MKKLLITILFILATGFTAHGEGLVRKTSKITYPDTYTNSGIQLMSTESEAESRLLNGFMNFEEEIDLSDLYIHESEMDRIYNKVLHQNPLYYYIDVSYDYFYDDETGYIFSICPGYIDTDKETIDNTLSAINDATEEILLYIDDGMNDFQKIMTVHDYMILNYQYDLDYEVYDISIMINKKGVCEAYTKAFTHVMNVLGIENSYVSSEAMNHIWNVVKVDGKWYNIDLTFDDPVPDHPDHTHHTYALLSDDKLIELGKHYDFEGMDSDISSSDYDEEMWHDNVGAFAIIDDVSYWIDDDNLVDMYGNVIFRELCGGDHRWSVSLMGHYFPHRTFAGLAAYNDKLYFNTEDTIYSYDPKTNKIEIVKKDQGICGLYVDRNDLRYCKYDLETQNFSTDNTLKIHLGNIRFGKPYIHDGKLISRIYKETSEPTMVFSFGNGICQGEVVARAGIKTFEFDITENQTLFFWDENMVPLKDKLVIDN